MLTVGGLVFLLACVFGSFVASGGAIGPLMAAMPFELLTILGAAIGTFIMANSMHDVKHTLAGFGMILKGDKYKKAEYIELLTLLFWFTRLASQRGAAGTPYRKARGKRCLQAFPEDPRRPPHHIADLRLSAHDRHERRRSAPDRRRNGA
jgi:hypothetical protein